MELLWFVPTARQGMLAPPAAQAPVRWALHVPLVAIVLPQLHGSTPRAPSDAMESRLLVKHCPMLVNHVNLVTTVLPRVVLSLTVWSALREGTVTLVRVEAQTAPLVTIAPIPARPR